MPNLSSIAGIEKEWDRLEYRARRLLGIYSPQPTTRWGS